MKWITEWKRESSPWLIEPGMRVLAIGSCFAEHVVTRLRLAKCQCALNPTGILYNPVSVAQALGSWLTGETLPQRFVNTEGVFHSLDHHTAVSAVSENELETRVAHADQEASQLVRQADVAIVSLGTAWVYEWKEDGRVVANCHKQPASAFRKRLLFPQEIVQAWELVLRKWLDVSPGLKLILTVSPVRHLKDGFVENQRSKSSLILAVAELERMFDAVRYFPAYELMIDELRDYRFYGRDLVHPNELAVEHIMDAFGECYFSKESRLLVGKLRSWQRGVEHRPFFPSSAGYIKHLEQLSRQLGQLKGGSPHLDWSAEESALAERYDQTRRST